MRGDNARAPRPAVDAIRAGEGCGWQNGKWLLMARVNLFDPGRGPEMSAGW
jgi:hypothetical protein